MVARAASFESQWRASSCTAYGERARVPRVPASPPGEVVRAVRRGELTVSCTWELAEEIAEVLKVSTVTVRRDWGFAKAWLHREISAAA